MKICRYIVAATLKRLKLFRTIISVNQLSSYGAVADMCEECDSCHDKTGRPVLESQSNPSFVSSVVKSNILLNDDLAKTRRRSVAKIQRTN